MKAKNYGTEFLFFLPENDDRVDPGFDFANELHTPKRKPLLEDQYAHQFISPPPYDGLMISRHNLDCESSKKKKDLIAQKGIREFLHLPNDFPLFGHCGSVSYQEKDHNFDTDNTIAFYQQHNCQYGASVDHLIDATVAKDEIKRRDRYERTIENAQDFLSKWQKGAYDFIPVGIVQGWDADSFEHAFQKLLAMGYQHIALAMGRRSDRALFDILLRIAPLIPHADFRLHLLGSYRHRIDTLRRLHELGVTSLGTASPMRQAFGKPRHNYFCQTDENYTAIRIPQTNNTHDDLTKSLEAIALQACSDYAAGTLDLQSALNAIFAYDKIRDQYDPLNESDYRRTLQDKPWESCSCPLCRQAGIQVLIFRGNNRNRRRGFHNTYIAYQQIQKAKEV